MKRYLAGVALAALLLTVLACTPARPPSARRDLPLLATATPFYVPSPTPTRVPKEATPEPPSLLPPSDVRPPESRQPGAPTAADLSIVKANLMRCRNDAVDEFWGGWTVNLADRNFLLASGRTEAIGRDAAGREVVRVPVRDFAISSAIAADWVIPTESNDRPSKTPLRGPAGQIARFDLDLNGVYDWTEVSPGAHRTRWSAAVAGHSVADGEYPAHTLRVRVQNQGRGSLSGVNLFAFVYDSAGRPVDMLSSDSVTIKEGEEGTVEATSLATDDRCRGPRDPNGYSADYWISFWSGNQLFAQLQNSRLP
jgi:hypothetical protein